MILWNNFFQRHYGAATNSHMKKVIFNRWSHMALVSLLGGTGYKKQGHIEKDNRFLGRRASQMMLRESRRAALTVKHLHVRSCLMK
jgi:hypothetical protein